MLTTRVPFLNLIDQHIELEDEILNHFQDILRSGKFINGPLVNKFEESFAEFVGVKHAIGVGSGTDALRFALMGCGLTSGQAVITVPNTFIATTEAITQAGALPLFVDVDEKSHNISISKLQEFILTSCKLNDKRELIHIASGYKVHSIIPVHLYGQMADMDPILEIAKANGLYVIEDACQAHGATYFSHQQKKWFNAGTMGDAAAFSFYPGKNLGAVGEAGAITTNNDQIARSSKVLRDHGQSTKYIHECEGYNGRLDTMQAAVLYVKLKHLQLWNDSRIQSAQNYSKLLANIEQVKIPDVQNDFMHVYHLYVIKCSQRDELQHFLSKEGVDTGLHYPIPLHLQTAYSRLGYKNGDFPISEKLSKEILSLPMYPNLKYEDLQFVVDRINDFYNMNN